MNTNKQKEIFILEPSKAIIEINSELQLYKSFFNQIKENVEKKENTIRKYNKIISNLKEENKNLKYQCKEFPI